MQSIVKRGIKLEYAVAFEPDFINFAKLTDSFKTLGLKGFCIPAAIGDQLRLVGLQAQGTSGANITSLGDAENYCLEVPGGMVINDVPITHIKMDIEGFELNALTGLRDILVKHHPSLAISVYHRPDDLVAIPRFIEDIGVTQNGHSEHLQIRLLNLFCMSLPDLSRERKENFWWNSTCRNCEWRCFPIK